jgi:hypothetical protein
LTRVLHVSPLRAADGAFDSPTEDFTITLDPATPTGTYTLEITVAKEGTDLLLQSYQVEVTR